MTTAGDLEVRSVRAEVQRGGVPGGCRVQWAPTVCPRAPRSLPQNRFGNLKVGIATHEILFRSVMLILDTLYQKFRSQNLYNIGSLSGPGALND